MALLNMTQPAKDYPPPGPSKLQVIKLIPPFIQGSGKNGSIIAIFTEETFIHTGMVLRTNKDCLLHVVSFDTIEDIFDNYSVIGCQLITSNQFDVIDPTAREAYYMYSARENVS